MLMFGELAYVADTTKTKQSIEFTFNKDEAQEYAVGFDNEQMKLGAWKGWARFYGGTKLSDTVKIEHL